jgi:hypothetical protein
MSNGEQGSTVAVTMGEWVQLHCAEHFPAEITETKIDEDGYAIMECPTGHMIIELT